MILIDTAELCAALNVDSAAVWRFMRSGDLPAPYAITGTPLAFWQVEEVFVKARWSIAVLVWARLVMDGRLPTPHTPQQPAAEAAVYI